MLLYCTEYGYWKFPNSVYREVPESQSPRVPKREKVASSRFKWVRVHSKCTRVHSSAEKAEKKDARRPPHGADAGRAPTKQQAPETPHCIARPRSPTVRSKAIYTKSDAPILDAMKLLWEVLRR